MELMTNYHWPRNVRQLENAIERAVVLCKGNFITPEDLPPEIIEAVNMSRSPKALWADEKTISIPLGTPLEVIEKRVIEETLRHSRGNKILASKILGISARTIYRKIEDGKKEPETQKE